MWPNIVILKPQVAAKIAAGEVVERPSAVVRELLDNAIDSGATQISLYLEEGGLQLIRVCDDGLGMSREDLELCYLPHATSKIRETNDLLKLCSLGFRGEALGSIAACSKLRITSTQQLAEGFSSYELKVADSLFQSLEKASAGQSGTQVEVRELFYSFPARRKFLKSNRAELTSCKAVFQEKALAFSHIHFRLYNHGKMEISLAPCTIPERICQIYSDLVVEQLFALEEQAEQFSLQIFVASPAIYRRDRKRMPFYINQRPIVEPSLQQAVRIGFDGYLAGGLFPICFCFMDIAPDRVDFNIHPAKREARLRNLSLLQASIRQTLRSFCREYGKLAGGANLADSNVESSLTENAEVTSGFVEVDEVVHGKGFIETEAKLGPKEENFVIGETKRSEGRNSFPVEVSLNIPSVIPAGPLFSFEQKNSNHRATRSSGVSYGNFSARDIQWNPEHMEYFGEHVLHENNADWQIPQPKEADFRYFGQLFEVFLLVERIINGVHYLLIVDQHASHERLLYETLKQEMLQQQPLLVPIELELEDVEQSNELLRQRSQALSQIGIRLEKIQGQNWRITSLPPSVADLKAELLQLVLHGASEAEDLKRELFAHLSCRKAIKKGDILDELSANELLRELFSKKFERCPHGRPLWYSLSQRDLYRLIQRT